MDTFEQTPLWRAALAEQEHDQFSVERETLRNAYRHFRKAGELLLAELPDEMRHLTVHDTSHVDALWDLGSRIAGDEMVASFTPTEAFVFGGAAIVHDLGLSAAAYPGGLEEIRLSDSYRTAHALATRQAQDETEAEIDRGALRQVIRLDHADKAIALASEPWDHPSAGQLFLIESVALRSAYGWLIGRIGASHGWSNDQLAAEFHLGVNQPAGYPAAWSVDPLKLACLLRLADAAHLDSSRAPHLLRAARKPQGAASLHWAFQERLHGAAVVGDRIRFSAGQPFDLSDAPAWWLAYDMVRAVDEEFRGIDSLLADLERQRFQVNGVLGAESPSRLAQSIPTRGWSPVNAQIHVGNVADLVERLGGAHLYGFNNTAALRELIQNSADAVRLRRLIDSQPPDWGAISVTLGCEDEELFIEVSDTGVGMTDAVMTNHLLNFGGSLWDSTELAQVVPDFDPGFQATGKFGIGFFSAFMLGTRVRVITRPRSSGPEGSKVLEIDQLSKRPVLRQATASERLSEPGTRIRVWLDDSRSGASTSRAGIVDVRRWASSEPDAAELAKLCSFLCPALDCRLEAEVAGVRAIAVEASDWLHINAKQLQERVFPPLGNQSQPGDFDTKLTKDTALAELEGWLSLVKDETGKIVGRAAIPAVDTPLVRSVVTVGGLRTRTADSLFGVFFGHDPSLARDSASLLATPSDLARWATEQAVLYAEAEDLPEKHSYFAASVLSYGGDPGPLKLCQSHEDRWLDKQQLSAQLGDCSSVEILPIHRNRETVARGRVKQGSEFAADLQIGFIDTPTAYAPRWTESEHEGNIHAYLQSIVQTAWRTVRRDGKARPHLLLTRG